MGYFVTVLLIIGVGLLVWKLGKNIVTTHQPGGECVVLWAAGFCRGGAPGHAAAGALACALSPRAVPDALRRTPRGVVADGGPVWCRDLESFFHSALYWKA